MPHLTQGTQDKNKYFIIRISLYIKGGLWKNLKEDTTHATNIIIIFDMLERDPHLFVDQILFLENICQSLER